MRQQQKHYDERIKCCVFFVSKKVESNALVHVHVQIIINWFINFTCMSLFSCCFHSSRHIHIRNMKLSRCYYEKNYSFCCCIFSIFSHWRIREKNRLKCLFVLLDNGGIETDCETFYSYRRSLWYLEIKIDFKHNINISCNFSHETEFSPIALHSNWIRKSRMKLILKCRHTNFHQFYQI